MTLSFPNEASLNGTTRFELQTFTPDGSDCAEILRRIADDDGPSTTPTSEIVENFPIQDDLKLEGVPTDRQLVVAKAFTKDDIAFLAGCDRTFDPTDGSTKEVEVLLSHIGYPSLNIRGVGVSRLVGRRGEVVPVPLRAQVQAAPDGQSVPIPGVPIRFQTGLPFGFAGGGISIEAIADEAGVAEVRVQLSDEPGTGSVRATAELVGDTNEVSYTVSTVDEARLSVITLSVPFQEPIEAMAAGEIDGDGPDLVLRSADALVALHDPLGLPTPIPIQADLGPDPVGLVVANLDQTAGDEIAVANRRRSGTESGSVRVFRSGGPPRIYPLTSSNAVDLAAVRQAGQFGLAVATTGATPGAEPCGETCSCGPGAACTNDVCVAADAVIEILEPDGDQLLVRNACSRPRPVCGNMRYTCDDPGGGRDAEQDECGCSIRAALRLGTTMLPIRPLAITAGPLRNDVEWDLLFPTFAGPQFATQNGGVFTSVPPPTLTQAASLTLIQDLDRLLDLRPDVLWVEPAPCLASDAMEEACPLARPPLPNHLGCLAAYQSENAGGVPELIPPDGGACQRHPLEALPSQICGGPMDGDALPDVALLMPSLGMVFVYSGDGYGGLLDPPAKFVVSAGESMLCADLDQDGKTEILIADPVPGRIHLLDQQ